MLLGRGVKRAAPSGPTRPTFVPVLPPEIDTVDGEAAAFNQLADCDERLDWALERGRTELKSMLSSGAEAGAFHSLMAETPRPALRTVRAFISSNLVPSDHASTAEGSTCTWSVKVWVAPQQQQGSGAEAFGEPVALARYLSVVHIDVASTPGVAVEWRASTSTAPSVSSAGSSGSMGGPSIARPASTPASGVPAGNAAPTGIEVTRTTAAVSELTAKVTIRLKQPPSAPAAGPVSTAARVKLGRALASVLALSTETHYGYAEVEEALWLLIKERGLLEVARRESSASIRVSSYPALAGALNIEHSTRSISLTELPRYLHAQVRSRTHDAHAALLSTRLLGHQPSSPWTLPQLPAQHPECS